MADYNDGTDSFFESYAGYKFDYIFIDADHHIEPVVRDFNNSLKWIKSNGIIFIHDLFPPDLRHTEQHLCGDGYHLLNHFLDNSYEFYTVKEDFGLTVVVKGKPVVNLKSIEYKELTTKFSEFSFSSEDSIKNLLTKSQNIVK